MANNELNIIDFSGIMYRKKLAKISQRDYNEFVDDFLDLIYKYELSYTGIMGHMSEEEQASNTRNIKLLKEGMNGW